MQTLFSFFFTPQTFNTAASGVINNSNLILKVYISQYLYYTLFLELEAAGGNRVCERKKNSPLLECQFDASLSIELSMSRPCHFGL